MASLSQLETNYQDQCIIENISNDEYIYDCKKCNVSDDIKDIKSYYSNNVDSNYNLNNLSQISLTNSKKKKKILCSCDQYIGKNENGTYLNKITFDKIKKDGENLVDNGTIINLYDVLLYGAKNISDNPWKYVENYFTNLVCGSQSDLNELKMQTRILLCKLFNCSHSDIRDDGGLDEDVCKPKSSTYNNVTTTFRWIGFIILLYIVYRSYMSTTYLKKSTFQKFIILSLAITIAFIIPYSININNYRKNKNVKNNGTPYSEISIILFFLQKMWDEFNVKSGWILPFFPMIADFMGFSETAIDKVRLYNLFFD